MKLFGFFGWFEAVTLAIAIGGPTLYVMDRETKIERGYCFAEGRYLSEQEIVDKAVEAILSERALSRVGSEEVGEDWVEYKDLNSFYMKQPFCCFSPSIKSAEHYGSQHDEWVNSEAYVIVLYQNLLSGENRFSLGSVLTDSCGTASGINSGYSAGFSGDLSTVEPGQLRGFDLTVKPRLLSRVRHPAESSSDHE